MPQFFVRTLSGRTITVEADRSDTIWEFKEKIQAEVGIPPEQQRLLFAGTELLDERVLCDYNMNKDICIMLVLRLPPPRERTPEEIAEEERRQKEREEQARLEDEERRRVEAPRREFEAAICAQDTGKMSEMLDSGTVSLDDVTLRVCITAEFQQTFQANDGATFFQYRVNRGSSWLHLAVFEERFDAAKLLMERGMTLDGTSPGGSVSIVSRYVFDHGYYDPDNEKTIDGPSPCSVRAMLHFFETGIDWTGHAQRNPREGSEEKILARLE